MKVLKRDGTSVDFKSKKILKAIREAFKATGEKYNKEDLELFIDTLPTTLQLNTDGSVNVETIQDIVENWLMHEGYYTTAKAYILYRENHKNIRFITDRIDYIQSYIDSNSNAASSSETDDNANVLLKNVANLNGEVFKSINRQIQRRRMKQKLAEMYNNNRLSNQYLKDLDSHIIYAHDESSFPVVMPYCSAYSLYPLITEGVGNIDGVTPKAPKNLDSFCGQFVNLVFLLASQVKGAVAFGGLFVAFNWYCVKEWGNNYYKKANCQVFTSLNNTQRTVEEQIIQYFQQIIWGINQPAGNRSSQSPFTNVSYYDKNYYNAMFEDFAYPDTTKPEWEQIDYLQRLFMRTLNKERLTSVIAFPVETMCLLSDGKEDILDKEYKEFTAQMYAEGHSFFTYISDSVDSLASCCRLRNEITENVFSFTNGLSGLKTGSCNVITLNLNRIVQNWAKSGTDYLEDIPELWNNSPDDVQENLKNNFKEYLTTILERIYKYHTAYKTMLYELESKNMLSASKAGYIRMQDLYSTIGLNGINEAAMFLGIEVSYNQDYIDFCRLITSTIKEQNKLHSNLKFKFNQEFVPAESLGIKNFDWDKADGYIVPNDGRVLYNSYFYDAHDDTSVFDKLKLHGKEMTETLDGGVGCHLNLNEHLSKEQYIKIIDYAIKVGCSYFTFNIPNTKCDKCGFITKHNVDKCPKCGSDDLTKYTRVIGYLRPTKSFSKGRQIEEKQRTYTPTEQC